MVQLTTASQERVGSHTFTYELDGKTYNHDLVGGKTATFLVRVDEPQTIKFWCEPHKPDMAGELAVQ